MNLQQKINSITATKEVTLLQAMQQMDKAVAKSLLIVADNKFITLISIGDIQRAILKNIPLTEAAVSVTRQGVKIAHTGDSLDEIKKVMLENRIECMPVVNDAAELVNVLFWEDIIGVKKKSEKITDKVPVVIMAGGFGTRLKPLTNVIPKPLIPITEKTIVEEIIARFCDAGLNDFQLTVNYKHELIRFYFESMENKNFTVDYFLESKPLGTAGSLALLKNKIASTFFVSNCDILIEEDYSAFYKHHKETGNEITVIASLKHLNIPYGTIESGEDGRIISMKEKPEITYLINTGMYILEPTVFDYIPDDTFIHITEVIEKIKSAGGKVGMYPVSELAWKDMGDWNEYSKMIEKYLA